MRLPGVDCMEARWVENGERKRVRPARVCPAGFRQSRSWRPRRTHSSPVCCQQADTSQTGFSAASRFMCRMGLLRAACSCSTSQCNVPVPGRDAGWMSRVALDASETDGDEARAGSCAGEVWLPARAGLAASAAGFSASAAGFSASAEVFSASAAVFPASSAIAFRVSSAVARFSSVTKFITRCPPGRRRRRISRISSASSPPLPPTNTASGSGHACMPDGALSCTSV